MRHVQSISDRNQYIPTSNPLVRDSQCCFESVWVWEDSNLRRSRISGSTAHRNCRYATHPKLSELQSLFERRNFLSLFCHPTTRPVLVFNARQWATMFIDIIFFHATASTRNVILTVVWVSVAAWNINPNRNFIAPTTPMFCIHKRNAGCLRSLTAGQTSLWKT